MKPIIFIIIYYTNSYYKYPFQLVYEVLHYSNITIIDICHIPMMLTPIVIIYFTIFLLLLIVIFRLILSYP